MNDVYKFALKGMGLCAIVGAVTVSSLQLPGVQRWAQQRHAALERDRTAIRERSMEDLKMSSGRDADHDKLSKILHEQQTRLREVTAQHRTREDKVERAFIGAVDRNNDHYLAPEEIMSTLHRCGYTGPCGYGDLELHVWPWQDEDISVRNASDQYQTTAYRVSTDFAERCVQKYHNTTENPKSAK